MTDINELRRLAQAATPHVGHACKYQDAHWLREGHVDFENADLFIASERPQEDAEFYAAANPATVIELLDRIEAAEKDIALKERVIDSLGSTLNAVANERDALRAKIEAMEKQEPVVEVQWAASIPNSFLDFISTNGYLPKLGDKLYLGPGAKGE